MILGVDTGFFISHTNQHPEAQRIWQACQGGVHRLIVSTLTINEIFTYLLKRGATTAARQWLSLIQTTGGIELIPVSPYIAALSARYRLGLQLPTVDSVILITFLLNNCERVITTDSHFQIVHQQNLIQWNFFHEPILTKTPRTPPSRRRRDGHYAFCARRQ